MKRVSVLLVLLTLVSLLAACGPTPTPETVYVTKEVPVTVEVTKEVQVTVEVPAKGQPAHLGFL